ncbi:MAG: ATP-grasp fold amidoligase family protein [bacterium]
MFQSRVKKILQHPQYLFLTLGHRGFFNWMKDETYIKIAYRLKMGKKLNLDAPKSYNEKLQWLKLNNYKPEYTKYVDKYEVREYIGDTIGDEYLIPLLGVWNKFEDIEFDALPEKFVLKCTHDSGGIVKCTDKNKFNRKAARRKISNSLKYNYFWGSREKPYRDIKPRIIAEQYMVDESSAELRDYKFFCFDGEVKALFIATNRGIDTRFDFFDMDFNHLPFMQHYKNADIKIEKPDQFNEMIEISRKLSAGIPHVRVDLYNVDGKVYFGELTFYHFSGLEKFEPEEWDLRFGSWIDLHRQRKEMYDYE